MAKKKKAKSTGKKNMPTQGLIDRASRYHKSPEDIKRYSKDAKARIRGQEAKGKKIKDKHAYEQAYVERRIQGTGSRPHVHVGKRKKKKTRAEAFESRINQILESKYSK